VTASVVVDTNVPLVASDRSGMPGPCVLACIAALQRVFDGERFVVLDEGGLVLDEYFRHLSASGQPTIGDAFLKWLLERQGMPEHVQYVAAPSLADGSFEHFPVDPDLAPFDPSDAKFVAVACAHPEKPPVLQASDSKWWGWKAALERCGVKVEFLCPTEVAATFARKFPKKPRRNRFAK
jgi:hypothetical protein